MSKAFLKQTSVEVDSVNAELGLVFGWPITCKLDGVAYFDSHGDHIPEESMLEASMDFMLNSRATTEMHVRKGAGTVVYAFPVTTEIAKAMGLQSQRTGLMIAMRPDAAMLEKFKSGELQAFSIGGERIEDEGVAA